MPTAPPRRSHPKMRAVLRSTQLASRLGTADRCLPGHCTGTTTCSSCARSSRASRSRSRSGRCAAACAWKHNPSGQTRLSPARHRVCSSCSPERHNLRALPRRVTAKVWFISCILPNLCRPAATSVMCRRSTRCCTGWPNQLPRNRRGHPRSGRLLRWRHGAPCSSCHGRAVILLCPAERHGRDSSDVAQTVPAVSPTTRLQRLAAAVRPHASHQIQRDHPTSGVPLSAAPSHAASHPPTVTRDVICSPQPSIRPNPTRHADPTPKRSWAAPRRSDRPPGFLRPALSGVSPPGTRPAHADSACGSGIRTAV
jgi:hypothetical protein